jgi:hypothetical protein
MHIDKKVFEEFESIDFFAEKELEPFYKWVHSTGSEMISKAVIAFTVAAQFDPVESALSMFSRFVILCSKVGNLLEMKEEPIIPRSVDGIIALSKVLTDIGAENFIKRCLSPHTPHVTLIQVLLFCAYILVREQRKANGIQDTLCLTCEYNGFCTSQNERR